MFQLYINIVRATITLSVCSRVFARMGMYLHRGAARERWNDNRPSIYNVRHFPIEGKLCLAAR